MFTSDESEPQDDNWSVPQLASDTVDVDIEFSSAETPGNPTENPDNWGNTANEKTIWMAIRRLSMGAWGDWQVSRIKGEKGSDGTSISVKGSYDNLDAFEADFGTEDAWKAPDNPSDCYIVGTDLYVWDGDSWNNVGPFRGEAGKSQYLHIKYAENVTYNEDGDPIVTNMSEEPNNYIGVYADENSVDSEDPKDYT